MNPKLRAWLQLFRVPNLFTVPGDPLAGFLIATGGLLDARAFAVAGASLCFYAAGLAMNDIVDLAEDQRDRPRRPLPSGAISPSMARAAILFLILTGLTTLWCFTNPNVTRLGAGLMVGVALYNFLTKRVPILGALNMGACRGLSVVLGGAAGFGVDRGIMRQAEVLQAAGLPSEHLVWMAQQSGQLLFTFTIFAGGIVALYIAAVTNLARYETQGAGPRWARFLPLLALFVGYCLLKQVTGRILMDASPTLWVMALVIGAAITAQILRDPPPPLAPRIGAFIRLLLLMQAALAVAPSVAERFPKTPHSLLVAGALLACFPVSAWVGRRFYAS